MAKRRSRMEDLFSIMSRDIRFATEGLTHTVSDILEQIAHEQVDDMRKTIINSPRPTSGPNGRVRTWDMWRSVEADVNVGNTRTTARVGYTQGGMKDYYYYQDNGFTHVGSGEWIEGTHALAMSYIKAREKFISEMNALGLKGGI